MRNSDATRLVTGEEVRRRATSLLLLEIDVGERLRGEPALGVGRANAVLMFAEYSRWAIPGRRRAL